MFREATNEEFYKTLQLLLGQETLNQDNHNMIDQESKIDCDEISLLMNMEVLKALKYCLAFLTSINSSTKRFTGLFRMLNPVFKQYWDWEKAVRINQVISSKWNDNAYLTFLNSVSRYNNNVNI